MTEIAAICAEELARKVPGDEPEGRAALRRSVMSRPVADAGGILVAALTEPLPEVARDRAGFVMVEPIAHWLGHDVGRTLPVAHPALDAAVAVHDRR